MSSTNKTTHYDLSQFTANDIPAWLSDYNSDMEKLILAFSTPKQLVEKRVQKQIMQ